MERKIRVYDDNTILASKIPTRPKMYELMDNSTSINQVVFLTPLGERKTLDEMKDEYNMQYKDIRSATYPIESFSLEYSEFTLYYNAESNGFFDKWVWRFEFTGNNDVDNKLEKVNNILDVIE